MRGGRDTNSGERRSELDVLISKHRWADARSIVRKALKGEPEDHWLLTRLSSLYYEDRKYKLALRYADQAIKLQPKCPLALWDYAGVLDMLGSHADAIRVLQKLVEQGVDRIASGECGEGRPWARSLVNDAYYKMGCCLAKLGRFRTARKYIRIYIDGRQHRIKSLYPVSRARLWLRNVEDRLRNR